MLKPAIQYADVLPKMYQSIWFEDKYKYYNYNSYWHTFSVEDKTQDWHEFVSINSKGEIIGYIHYYVNRITLNCTSFGAINFTNDPTFGKDLLQVIKDIFERFNFHKLTFGVVIGNPAEKSYDHLCAKYGGRILCIEKEETKLEDNNYYDVKRYEILREDYLRCKTNMNKQ
jgi:hypothetical protein